MYDNITMNSPRPVQDFTDKMQYTSYNEMSEKYKEQLEKNQNLEKELLKNKIQMKNLEEKLNAKLEKDYSVINNI